jgi:DNA polymerase-3 subunit epsilon
MENAHEAMADIRATVDVLTHQLLILEDVPKTAPELALYCYPIDPDAFDLEGKLRYIGGELAINFGKNKGKTLAWLARNDRGYLEWILNGTFSEQVKTAVRDCL